jgi:transposase
MGSRFDTAFKAQAIRLVRDHVGEYPSEWAAISAVAYRLGVSAETLRVWLRREELTTVAAGGGGADAAGDGSSLVSSPRWWRSAS